MRKISVTRKKKKKILYNMPEIKSDSINEFILLMINNVILKKEITGIAYIYLAALYFGRTTKKPYQLLFILKSTNFG